MGSNPAMDSTAPLTPDTQPTVAVFAVAISCIIFSVIAVGMRLTARYLKRIPLAADDYLILVALAANVAFGGLTIREVVVGGVGRHAMDLNPARLIILAQLLIGCQILFAFSLGCIKASICSFYIRIFETNQFKIMASIVLGFCTLWCIAAILTPLLQCQPIQANWDKSAGHCGDQVRAFVAIAVVDIVTDMAIMALPIPMILKLQMPLATRIGLIVMFSAGLLTMIVSALRVYNLSNVDYSDPSWSTPDSFIWSMIEPTVGLMIACAPMCRSLFGSVFRSVARSRLESSGRSGTGGHHSERKNFNRMDDDIALREMGHAASVHRSARASGQMRGASGSRGPLGHRSHHQHQQSHPHDGLENSSAESIDYPGAIKVRTDVTVEERSVLDSNRR